MVQKLPHGQTGDAQNGNDNHDFSISVNGNDE